MIPFIARDTKYSLFQNRIAPIPERNCKTDILMTIRDSGEPVFIPAVGTGASMIVRERFPRSAVRTVVFPDRPPGPFAEVWPPALPMLLPERILFQPSPFSTRKSLGTRSLPNCFCHRDSVRLTPASSARRLRCAQTTTESSACPVGALQPKSLFGRLFYCLNCPE